MKTNTYTVINESGRHFDMWTWYNRKGLYRSFGIGQSVTEIRSFFGFDNTRVPMVSLITAHLGPWVVYLYQQKEN